MKTLTNAIVADLAAQLGIQEPTPSQKKHDNPISRLHELGHFALKKVAWFETWSNALKPSQLSKASCLSCPWIPNIGYLSVDPLPDEHGVQLWCSLVLEALQVQAPIAYKLISVGQCDPTWGHGKDPWLQLSEWSIDPRQGWFLPEDDGFELPHPIGLNQDQIIDNLEAIQGRYPERVPRLIDYRSLLSN